MWIAENWNDYELIDASDGERLERFGKYTLVRPDPQIIWKGVRKNELWKCADASYKRSNSGGGSWNANRLPEKWDIEYQSLGLTFQLKAMGFKHTGIFPEQAVNWEWFSNLIKDAGRPIKVLNLFAYTGGATAAAAKAGAAVCHVDAARGMVGMAKENLRLSGLSDAPVRYIVDDCRKFVEREIRRGSKYDAIIMDPPSYGRGPSGEIWKLEDNICDFIELTANVMSEKPLFFLVNFYTTGVSPSVMGYLLNMTLKKRFGGTVTSDEVGLPIRQTGIAVPCGAAARIVF